MAPERIARLFQAAWESGNTAALKATLAADAVVVCDSDGRLPAPVRHGRAEVAQRLTSLLRSEPGTVLSAESVNGRTGLVVHRAGQAVAVVSLSVAGAEVSAVWIVVNPEKLRSWNAEGQRR